MTLLGQGAQLPGPAARSTAARSPCTGASGMAPWRRELALIWSHQSHQHRSCPSVSNATLHWDETGRRGGGHLAQPGQPPLPAQTLLPACREQRGGGDPSLWWPLGSAALQQRNVSLINIKHYVSHSADRVSFISQERETAWKQASHIYCSRKSSSAGPAFISVCISPSWRSSSPPL